MMYFKQENDFGHLIILDESENLMVKGPCKKYIEFRKYSKIQ